MPIPMTLGGTVSPSRFVKQSAVADNQCLQATAGSGEGTPIIGITQYGTSTPPYPGLQAGNAGLIGQSCQIYQEAENAVIECGGTVTAGDQLKSDSTGRGVTASTDGDYVGARAAQSGITGQLIQCLVLIGQRGS